ncbi:glycerophosphodiester phosphodiesterase family protein [Flectobacillus roseus]
MFHSTKKKILFLICSCLFSCKESDSSIVEIVPQEVSFDVQAHRGGAGEYPENTLVSFLNGIEVGAKTLEMDVCITKDSQVVVSHDLALSTSFVTTPNGLPLKKTDPVVNIYQTTYDELQKYDVGLRRNSSFPYANLLPCKIPLLRDVLTKCEEFAKLKKRKINYNIEIKIGKKGVEIPSDNKFYWSLIETELERVTDYNRVIIQCFDPTTLKNINKWKKKQYRLSFLTAGTNINTELQKLDFTPSIYSPYYKSIDSVGINVCHSKKIAVIPYVIDTELEFNIYKNIYKVDGIITDYPKKMIEKIKAGAL